MVRVIKRKRPKVEGKGREIEDIEEKKEKKQERASKQPITKMK